MKTLSNPLLKITAPPLGVLILHIFATEFGLYESFWWFDIPMHFIGGLGVAVAIIEILNIFVAEKKLVIESLILKTLFIIGLTALFAVAWEFLEFFLDFYYSAGMQSSLTDTMKDLSMGIIGANVIAGLVLLKSYFKK